MNKLKQWGASPSGQKAGNFYKKAETGVWRVLDPVGKVSNKLAGKVGAESFWPTELADGEIEKAARILRTFTVQGAQADDGADATGGVNGGPPKTEQELKQSQINAKKTQKVIKRIPPNAFQGAVGVAIFTCFRGGIGFSGAGGSGVVLAKKPDGSWSPPSGILIHTLGWGLLIGLDIYDVVLIIRTPRALEAFLNPKVSIGGELSVTAGPVGNGATVDSGVEASPCWSYTKSKGAYAGLQLDGTIMLKRDDANTRFYGSEISVQDIFAGKPITPSAAKPLLQTLYTAEGRLEVMGTDQIPQGLAPGDTEFTEEEKKELGHQQGETPSSSSNLGYQPRQPHGHRVPPPLAPPAYDTISAAPVQPPPEKS